MLRGNYSVEKIKQLSYNLIYTIPALSKRFLHVKAFVGCHGEGDIKKKCRGPALKANFFLGYF